MQLTQGSVFWVQCICLGCLLVFVFRLLRMHEVQTVVCLSRGSARLRCAKMAEQIEILFGLKSLGGLTISVLDVGPDPPTETGEWSAFKLLWHFVQFLVHVYMRARREWVVFCRRLSVCLWAIFVLFSSGYIFWMVLPSNFIFCLETQLHNI